MELKIGVNIGETPLIALTPTPTCVVDDESIGILANHWLFCLHKNIISFVKRF